MTTTWIPLVPSVLIEAGEIEQSYINGKDVAVWRSVQGQVHIWENRCPHRSVRLSLGKVQDDSLVCAYHGWHFSGEDGHCQRIPAQPDQRAPKSLCVKTYPVAETEGMIWFGEGVIADFSVPVQIGFTSIYAGSVTVSTGLDTVQEYLSTLDFQPSFQSADKNAWIWQGAGEESILQLYLSPVKQGQVMLHAMLLQEHTTSAMHPVLKKIRHYFQQEQYNYA